MSVPSRGREGAWQKIKTKKVKRGGGLAAPEYASIIYSLKRGNFLLQRLKEESMKY